MKLLFTIVSALFMSFHIQAQDRDALQFPDDFFGIYKGTLEIHSDNGGQNVPMEFHLIPTSMEGKYEYTLVYGEGDRKQERKYHLMVQDGSKGTYVVDENNGILLDNRVWKNKMYTLFEVNGSLLTTFISFQENYLDFEIIFAQKEEKRKTVPTEDPEMEVLSYPISTIQVAKLFKE